MAKQKKIDLGHMTEEEKMKYEIAGELGLLDRVLNDGWRSLTAKETGRIGGLDTAEAADGGGRAERSRRKITGSFLIRVYWNIRTKGLY